MCCNRSLKTKTKRLHEKCLRMVSNDKNSTFNELFDKDVSVRIHHQKLQKLAVNMFKVSKGSSPKIINEMFQFGKEITYELRQTFQFSYPFC